MKIFFIIDSKMNEQNTNIWLKYLYFMTEIYKLI